MVQEAGLQVTIHAGEADDTSSIYQAINELHATRIGHGTNAIHDEKLMKYMHKHDDPAVQACDIKYEYLYAAAEAGLNVTQCRTI